MLSGRRKRAKKKKNQREKLYCERKALQKTATGEGNSKERTLKGKLHKKRGGTNQNRLGVTDTYSGIDKRGKPAVQKKNSERKGKWTDQRGGWRGSKTVSETKKLFVKTMGKTFKGSHMVLKRSHS